MRAAFFFSKYPPVSGFDLNGILYRSALKPQDSGTWHGLKRRTETTQLRQGHWPQQPYSTADRTPAPLNLEEGTSVGEGVFLI